MLPVHVENLVENVEYYNSCGMGDGEKCKDYVK